MPVYYREQFIKAIPKSAGLISVIAERVGCDWHTAKKWIDRDDELSDMVISEVESTIDIAEASLLNEIKKGDVSAIKFYLTTKGKHRGYIQTTRIEGKYDVRQIDFNQLSDEQIKQLADGNDPEVVFNYSNKDD